MPGHASRILDIDTLDEDRLREGSAAFPNMAEAIAAVRTQHERMNWASRLTAEFRLAAGVFCCAGSNTIVRPRGRQMFDDHCSSTAAQSFLASSSRSDSGEVPRCWRTSNR